MVFLSQNRSITLRIFLVILVLLLLSNPLLAEKPLSHGARQYRLEILAEPADAKVEILNLDTPYQPNMLLSPGRYYISVSAPGHEIEKGFIDISDRDWKGKVTLDLLVAPANLDEGWNKLEEEQNKLRRFRQEMSREKMRLEQNKKEIAKAYQEMEKERGELDRAYQNIEKERRELVNAHHGIEKERRELVNARQDMEKERGKATAASQEIEKERRELAKVQQEIEKERRETVKVQQEIEKERRELAKVQQEIEKERRETVKVPQKMEKEGRQLREDNPVYIAKTAAKPLVKARPAAIKPSPVKDQHVYVPSSNRPPILAPRAKVPVPQVSAQTNTVKIVPEIQAKTAPKTQAKILAKAATEVGRKLQTAMSGESKKVARESRQGGQQRSSPQTTPKMIPESFVRKRDTTSQESVAQLLDDGMAYLKQPAPPGQSLPLPEGLEALQKLRKARKLEPGNVAVKEALQLYNRRYLVYAGLFRQRERADLLTKNIRELGLPAFQQPIHVEEKPVIRVCVGLFLQRDHAVKGLQLLKEKLRMKDAFLRAYRK